MKAKDKEKYRMILPEAQNLHRDTDCLHQSILAEISNAGMANPPKPVKTDLDILAILNSMEKKLATSIEEFKSVDRQDLVDKEQTQLDLVKGYAGEVDVMSPEDLEKIVVGLVEKGKEEGKKLNVGELVKATLAEVEAKGDVIMKSQVAAAAKKALGIP
ncbi:hypothetical protein ABW19_dt0205472 [Dactylella cylindrospora]|nr:hypothetical protein ABW19_dt0205472 [Dactylella cylindrospora]